MNPEKELDLSGEAENTRISELDDFVSQLPAGESFAISCSDADFLDEIEGWCDRAGHELVSSEVGAGQCYAMVRKGDLVEN